MRREPRQTILRKLGASCTSTRQSWHATSPDAHIFFCWRHFYDSRKKTIIIMKKQWDKTKYGYEPMEAALNQCIEGTPAKVLIQVIRAGTGEYYEAAASIEYTITSYYFNVDVTYDKSTQRYMGKILERVNV